MGIKLPIEELNNGRSMFLDAAYWVDVDVNFGLVATEIAYKRLCRRYSIGVVSPTRHRRRERYYRCRMGSYTNMQSVSPGIDVDAADYWRLPRSVILPCGHAATPHRLPKRSLPSPCPILRRRASRKSQFLLGSLPRFLSMPSRGLISFVHVTMKGLINKC